MISGPDILALLIYPATVLVLAAMWVGVGVVVGRRARARRARDGYRPEVFEGHTIGWRRAVRGDKEEPQ